MSLKGFHIVFIIFSTLLALGIGASCIWVDLVEGAPIYLAGAILSLAAAVVLVIYGAWFYRKMKRLRIITCKGKFCRSCFCGSFHHLDKRWHVRLVTEQKMADRPSTWRWHSAADRHGVRSPISTHLEFSVVLIEAVLLLGFAIPLWAKRVNQFPPGKEALVVHVVGQQFSWNFQLAGPDGQFGRRDISFVSNSNPMGLDPNDPAGKDDIITQGELHVPVNRPVIIELSSRVVI